MPPRSSTKPSVHPVTTLCLNPSCSLLGICVASCFTAEQMYTTKMANGWQADPPKAAPPTHNLTERGTAGGRTAGTSFQLQRRKGETGWEGFSPPGS